MSSNPTHTPRTGTPSSSREYTIRGLLLLTFGLALVLAIYRHLPEGSIPLLFAVMATAYLLFVLWGGILCLVELFRKILRRL